MRQHEEKPVHPFGQKRSDLIALVEEILRGLPDATVWIGTAGKIETLNPAAAKLFGYDEKELCGYGVSCLLAEPYFQADFEILGQYFEQAERLPGKKREILGRKKNGEVFPLEVGLRAARLQKQQYFCASIRDLSEVLEREDERIQSQKLEAIGRLTSGIAHDFNNLLMGIMGCAHIALARIDENDSAYRFVNEIVEAAKRGAALPAQLLAFGQKRGTEIRRVEVAHVFDSMSEILRRTLGEKTQFVSQIAEPAPSLHIEVGQLEQALMHLILNARDAMPQGGRVEMTASTQSVDVQMAAKLQLVPGEYASIEVNDTGCGIDEVNRGRVFEPYFTTKNGGRGLGLSSVYGFVRRAQGHIVARPRSPQGTSIRLLLPLFEKSAAQHNDAEAAAERTNQTILVVENAELVRMAIVHSLEQAGFHVLQASHWDEAVALADGVNDLDFLLTDWVLPCQSGAQLSRLIRAKHPSVKTVLITAFARIDMQARLQGQESEFPVVLQKPFDDVDLLNVLSYLQGHGALRKSVRIFETRAWMDIPSAHPELP